MQPRQNGLGLIEIMVAIALGLFLVASVAALVVGQLAEQRRLLLESRLNQDLRATADLIVRDLRRAGHWGSAERGVWSGGAVVPQSNPYAGLHPGAGISAASLGYSYSRDISEDQASSSNEKFGFRVNANTQAFELRMGGNNLVPGNGDQWQPLTDPSLLRITRWQVRHESQAVSLIGHCAGQVCPTGSSTCPPTWWLRQVHIELEASDARDSSVRRSLVTQVRLRNDEVSGACPGA
jgi:type IV pilus assembly protein PilW